MSPGLTSPVIILSPAVRAGTTLLQRLLCSAPNTLVFGDSVGQEMEFFARYATVKEQMLQFHEFGAAAVRNAVLAGDTADFITSLAPPAPAQQAGWKAAGLAWVQVCLQEAQEAGRPVWGWKMAGADGIAIRRLAEWFPHARWVWIHRELADCFRSAKAAGMVSGPADAASFAQAAAAASAAFAELALPALVLDYAAMIQDPTGTVCALEAFTGARGIQAEVFKVRVNQPGCPTPVPPATLTPDEAAALRGDFHLHDAARIQLSA